MSTDVATLVLAVDANAVKQGGVELDKFTQKGKGAEEQTKKLTTATGALRQAYGDIAKAFAAWQIGGFIKDSAMMAARFETLGIVMKIAGNNAGYTRAETEKFAKSLQEQGISMMQSRDAVIQLATANIDLSKAAGLGRAAQDLAVVANINSSEAMMRMIQAIKAGEQEILRTMGMNVSWEASYKKLAAQLGINSTALTEQQKVMARTNAVLEESIKYQGIYEEAMGTAGKAISSLTRYWDNLKIKMGELFLPALSDSVDTLTRALKASNAELDKASKDGTVQNYGNSLALLVKWSTNAAMLIGNGFSAAAGYITRLGAAAAAEVKFLAQGNAAAAQGVREAWKADNSSALSAAAAFSDSVLNGKPATAKTTGMSEEERIKQGAAARAKTAAETAAFGGRSGRGGGGGTSVVNSEAKAYADLAKSIREKTAAATLEGNGQDKLTEGQKTAAKFANDLASGELKLTAVHKASITTLLEKQIAVEKQNQQSKAYAEALESIKQSVVTADDATRDLNAAQKVLLELMRSPEWEDMPEVWKETAIQANATATAELKVLEIRQEMDSLIANTDTQRLERQREQMQRIADAYMDNKFGLEGSTEAMQQYSEVVDVALGRNATSLEKEASAMSEFTRSAAENMQKTLADFLFDPFADGMDGMLRSFGVTIQKMIAQAAAAELMKRLFGDMGKTGEVGGLIGGALSFIGGSFASGTDYVPRDMIAQIHKGEQIIPASENKQTRQGTSTNVVYNATVNLPAGTPSETRKAAGTGMREALMAFESARRYG